MGGGGDIHGSLVAEQRKLIFNSYVKYYVMSFSNFVTSFDRLQIVLRDRLGNGKDTKKLDIYGSYIQYNEEIKIIINRIESESQNSILLSEKLFEALRKDEPHEQFAMESIRNFILISVDIKSFFIFTRIFLDTLAKIIGQCYSGKSGALPWRMRELVKSKTLRKIDSDFAKGLEDRMRWVDDFVETRVEIEHYLGKLYSTPTKNGEYGFDILGLRTRKEWGTDTVKSITQYIEQTLCHLSEVISYIHNKFQSMNAGT